MAIFLKMIGETFYLQPNSVDDLDITWDCYSKSEPVAVVPASFLKTMLEHLPAELHHHLEVDVSLNPFRVAQTTELLTMSHLGQKDRTKIHEGLKLWRQSTSEQYRETKRSLNAST